MEYLVDFEVTVPAGTPAAETEERFAGESVAAASLADAGHLLRVWKRPDDGAIVGLYRANDSRHLDALLKTLPLYPWMRIDVTPLEAHPNDPARVAAKIGS
ncbi:muconolactone Delta-isomerase family protein [Solirubrobacter phytolaccae]|uniref:Muconolactone Delta-isomerase family protein n=1 Tax=Solirubrobacter phytolaccae TaxID=1404360 RepID=A0A9X3S650_9ACTN|nr:muconolactone Delta-isomerase family protein [Solirubrobacter phytolaccae]MDA0179629.1 muconolactone Delta-isomerase family protein [Solirubrobacter phytolaccae]